MDVGLGTSYVRDDAGRMDDGLQLFQIFCVAGNRGAQEQVTDCPRYCERQAFLYPKHLQMMGRYNSLFALAPALFQNPAEMGRAYAAHGVKRFVLNLL